MTTTVKNAVKAELPKLPKLPSVKKGSAGTCLCGCPTPTASRFAPGHDSVLLAAVIRVERNLLDEAPFPHTEMAAIEIGLRKKAGLTGKTHTKALITAADVVNVPKAKAKVARKPRLVKAAAPVIEPVVEIVEPTIDPVSE